MSIGVELTELHATLAELERPPYVLTVGDDGRAHCVAVAYEWRDDELALGAGNRTMANATARPNVSLLWPPNEPGGYSLIVDGDVTHTEGTGGGDNVVVVRATAWCCTARSTDRRRPPGAVPTASRSSIARKPTESAHVRPRGVGNTSSRAASIGSPVTSSTP